MAQIVKRKSGYLIRVSCGYSADGTTQKTQSMTWKPPRAGMTEKQIEKALNKAAFEFEEKCRSGQTVNAEKFENFCETWFENYAKRTLKQSGIDRCRQYCPRVYEQLGHLRLDRITPYEVDNFILWLTKEKVRNDPEFSWSASMGITGKAPAAATAASISLKRSPPAPSIFWASADMPLPPA